MIKVTLSNEKNWYRGQPGFLVVKLASNQEKVDFKDGGYRQKNP